uniref:Uncharacterized protein n=1 Tax=viral metagenome TaxID=1070528 RepID=A0A6C0J4Y9_9ZZZZ
MHGSKSDLQVFRDNINKFIEQLVRIYPEDKDLMVYKDKVALYAKVDPRGMVEYFMNNMSNYTVHIMERNDDFFLKDLAIEQVTQKEKYRELFDKVRKLWLDGMTNETKNTVWQYFVVFVTLGAKITQDHNTITTINKYRKIPLKI